MVSQYEPVIGIDLGTTYSCVGLWLADGTVKILTDEFGSTTVPSVIYFKGENNFETAVGKAAYQAAKDSGSGNDNTLIYDIKRLLGKLPNDQEIESLKADWPF